MTESSNDINTHDERAVIEAADRYEEFLLSQPGIQGFCRSQQDGGWFLLVCSEPGNDETRELIRQRLNPILVEFEDVPGPAKIQ